jgi:phosphoenolpyruvate-protein kinase (PTS system EI component)
MRTLQGLPASPGEALGVLRRLDPPLAEGPPLPPEEALAAARAALTAAGEELEALGARLRAEGRADEAEIVETGVLMAADPGLDATLEHAVAAGRSPAAALVEACGVHADAIAALPDPLLAARAEDVRSLGRRAARKLGATPVRGAAPRAGARPAAGTAAPREVAQPVAVTATRAGDDAVLVADELGPADVAELDASVAGIALAGGAPSAHAAVVARGLGIPMVVALGDELLGLEDGVAVALDGEAGRVVAEPGADRARAARAAQERRRVERARAEAAAGLPAVTADGRAIRVLVNAATAAEVAAGLRAGAEGVGLLRTELSFLEAAEWPTEADHRRVLAPVLAPLAGRVATVRVLDFGADKTPPFLAGIATRGLALLLEHPEALEVQLRAIVAAAAATRLRVLLPLVESPTQVDTVRELLPDGVELGAMIETRAAVAAAAAIARAADFLSIGTNDLTADVLGADRFAGGGPASRAGAAVRPGAAGAGAAATQPGAAGADAAATHDPRVLRAIEATVAASGDRSVEVCGEAAGDPVAMPLLVGLGVDELSVGAARVGATRAGVRALNGAAELARRALELPDAGAVEALVREAGDAAAQRLEGHRTVVAVGPEP